MHSALEGRGIDDCPYQNKRKPSGKLSWSRSFISAWRDGWQYAINDPEDAKITAKHAGSWNGT
jgi:ribosome modulation factor